MSSNNLPTYIESETDQFLDTLLQTDFEALQTYAYNYGNYLLEDPLYQIFETTYTTSHILNSTLLQFTTPIADCNVQAIRKLRNLQKSNLRRATKAYEHLISPRLQARIQQPYIPGRQDSPILRVLTPSRIDTPIPPNIPTSPIIQPVNNIPRRTN